MMIIIPIVIRKIYPHFLRKSSNSSTISPVFFNSLIAKSAISAINVHGLYSLYA